MIEIFVPSTVELITNIFTKVEKYYNQNKIPVPEDIEQFFYLKSSIISYLIANDAFGRKYIQAPDELLANLKALEEMHIIHFGKTINIYKQIKDIHPPKAYA